jgi:hypothetical protein
MVTSERGCLEDGELAAFAEGRGSASARAEAEAHLARCPECYELFVAVARSIAEDAPALLAPARTAPARFRPFALAAGLAAAILAGVWSHLRALEAPPAGPETASATEALAALAGPQALARVPPLGLGHAYGFGPASPGWGAAARVGVLHAGLELALLAGDRERATAARDAAARELEALAVPAQPYRGLPPDAGPDRARLALRAAGLDPAALQFGQWLEAGRLAAAVREPRLLRDPRLRAALAVPPGQLLPATARRLELLRRQLDAEPADPTGWDQLERGFRGVILLL